MTGTLRRDVRLTRVEDGTELHDRLTGLRINVDGDLPWQEEGARIRLLKGPTEVLETLRALSLFDEALPDDEVRAKQRRTRERMHDEARWARCTELLEHCVSRVPYYRDRRAAYATPVQSEADLQRLPLMRKSDLRANFPQGLLSDDVDLAAGTRARTLELAATSGTTGERLQTVVDLSLDAVPDNYAELWGLPDSEATPKTAVLTGPLCIGTECHLGKLPFEERIRADYTLVLNSADDLFSMDRALVENIAQEMWRFRPDFLLVNPFYLHHFGNLCQQLGIELPPLALILTSYQYLSELQRRALERIFRARTVSYYAATELGGCRVAVECARGHTHVREDQSWVEVVGERAPRPSGALGALAVTTVAGRTAPLVRYLLGDVGRRPGGRCDCALADWELLELHGRVKDMLHLDGRWVTTREVDQAVSRFEHVDFYRCTQVGAAQLELQVVESHAGAVDAAELERALGAELRASKVSVRPVRRLEPEVSLKFRLTENAFAPVPEWPWP